MNLNKIRVKITFKIIHWPFELPPGLVWFALVEWTPSIGWKVGSPKSEFASQLD